MRWCTEPLVYRAGGVAEPASVGDMQSFPEVIHSIGAPPVLFAGSNSTGAYLVSL
jgi:hypothetical protein